jgi:predicted nucleic acid-binding protein
VTFFVDANIIIYSAVPSEQRDGSMRIIEAVGRGDIEGRTSTAALEEVWHAESTRRAGDINGLTGRAYAIFTPLLPVTDETFRIALSLEVPRLDTLDRVHAATCFANGIERIVSADKGFDGVRGLRRVDPLNARALGRLLADSG